MPAEEVKDKLMSTSEVAEYLNVSIDTIRRWRYHRKGPAFLRIGKVCRYWRSEVDAWIESENP